MFAHPVPPFEGGQLAGRIGLVEMSRALAAPPVAFTQRSNVRNGSLAAGPLFHPRVVVPLPGDLIEAVASKRLEWGGTWSGSFWESALQRRKSRWR